MKKSIKKIERMSWYLFFYLKSSIWRQSLEDSNKSPAIKAFSSGNDFGFEYTKVKENFFVKFSIPKHNFSQTEHLNKVSQDHFDLSGPKIEFGLNF